MQIDLTQIILAVITLLFAILTKYVVPLIQTKLDAHTRETLNIAIRTAVYAAEQLYTSGQGQQKKQYVIELLKKQGYVANTDAIEETLNAKIEAIVKELDLTQEYVLLPEGVVNEDQGEG